MIIDRDLLEEQLVIMRSEHRKLDDEISNHPHDPIALQRLKKRKLQIKDRIAYLENALLPDIIA